MFSWFLKEGPSFDNLFTVDKSNTHSCQSHAGIKYMRTIFSERQALSMRGHWNGITTLCQLSKLCFPDSWVSSHCLLNLSLISLLYSVCRFITWLSPHSPIVFSLYNGKGKSVRLSKPIINPSNVGCTRSCLADLLIIAKFWKQPKCPSVGEWINKLWYIYPMAYYLAIRQDKLTYTATWVEINKKILLNRNS